MPAIAIELNGAEICIAGASGVLATEPGCALMDGARLRIGDEALRAARLFPAQTHDRFWSKLSVEPLAHSHPQASSVADLAFAQLSSLWTRFGSEGSDVVFVVPAWFEKEPLGLLAGIADACGIRTRGLVNAAVASSRRPYADRALVHLDAGQHEVALTLLDQGSGVSVDSVAVDRGFGLATLHEAWIARIARVFLAQTRFDPLHDAEAEQALFDHLAPALEALAARDSARIEIEIRGSRYLAEVKRSDLIAVAEPYYAQLAALVQRARPGSGGLAIQLSDRLVRLPGLVETLARAGNVEMVRLTPDAACAGALERAGELTRDSGLVLVKRLGWSSYVATPAPSSRGPIPSHVVVDGLAHALGSGPLAVGSGTIRLAEDGAVLEGIPHATRPEGEPVSSETRLRAGDRVRLGQTSEILLIALAESDEP